LEDYDQSSSKIDREELETTSSDLPTSQQSTTLTTTQPPDTEQPEMEAATTATPESIPPTTTNPRAPTIEPQITALKTETTKTTALTPKFATSSKTTPENRETTSPESSAPETSAISSITTTTTPFTEVLVTANKSETWRKDMQEKIINQIEGLKVELQGIGQKVDGLPKVLQCPQCELCNFSELVSLESENRARDVNNSKKMNEINKQLEDIHKKYLNTENFRSDVEKIVKEKCTRFADQLIIVENKLANFSYQYNKQIAIDKQNATSDRLKQSSEVKVKKQTWFEESQLMLLLIVIVALQILLIVLMTINMCAKKNKIRKEPTRLELNNTTPAMFSKLEENAENEMYGVF